MADSIYYLTEEQQQRIRVARKRNPPVPWKKIAKELAWPHGSRTLRHFAQRHGLINRRKMWAGSKQRQKKFLSFIEKGLTIEEIAEKMKVSSRTVAVWRFRLKLPPHRQRPELRKRYGENTRLRWKLEAVKRGYPKASSGAQCKILEVLRRGPMTVKEIIDALGREVTYIEQNRVRSKLWRLVELELVQEHKTRCSTHKIVYRLLAQLAGSASCASKVTDDEQDGVVAADTPAAVDEPLA